MINNAIYSILLGMLDKILLYESILGTKRMYYLIP
uniref:Uncharacterized protein n=1 Tax=Anguilla anguilla TaxID=7936 RepID=A0A0E9W7Z4_ANGAN